MPKQPRKQARKNAAPITTNPLFPAVVALWFGALFGLGSLAVRPSLLESLVVQSRIDLIVPAAAPPLGVTARALVALILAAIGAAIGTVIARRLARPKPEKRERQRTSLKTSEAKRHSYNAAPVAEDAEDQFAGGNVFGGRRRALTTEHEQEASPYVPANFAPLPGGEPQVLDIASMGISSDVSDSPLDLGAYADRDDHFPAAVSAPEPSADDLHPLRNRAATPLAEPAAFAMPDHFPSAPAAVSAFEPAPQSEAVAAAADGRQVFGISSPEAPEPATRQIFGQAIADDHVSPDFIKAAGFTTTVFDAPEPAPLFAREPAMPEPMTVKPAEPEAVFAAESVTFASPTATSPVDLDAPETVEPAPRLLTEPAPEALAPVVDLPSPDSLGMTDLAARLAESMARRRAARSGTPYVAPIAADTAEAPVPEPVEAKVAHDSVEAEPPAEPLAARLEAKAVETAPPVAEVEEIVAPVAPPMTSLPAALRPIGFDLIEDQAADSLDDLLPPRRLVVASEPEVAPALPEPASAVALPVDADEIDESDDGGDDAAEDNHYGSLLGISTPRNVFVRIEEAEDQAAAIEPVVIFPGQMARPVLVEEPASFRQFDSPEAAGQGQAVAVSETAPTVDREEADRALRMALANLQRMSGAA